MCNRSYMADIQSTDISCRVSTRYTSDRTRQLLETLWQNNVGYNSRTAAYTLSTSKQHVETFVVLLVKILPSFAKLLQTGICVSQREVS